MEEGENQDNQIARGKKWDLILKKFKLKELQKDYEWIESQPSIMNDIQVYKDSIKTEEPKKDTSKKKAQVE